MNSGIKIIIVERLYKGRTADINLTSLIKISQNINICCRSALPITCFGIFTLDSARLLFSQQKIANEKLTTLKFS